MISWVRPFHPINAFGPSSSNYWWRLIFFYLKISKRLMTIRSKFVYYQHSLSYSSHCHYCLFGHVLPSTVVVVEIYSTIQFHVHVKHLCPKHSYRNHKRKQICVSNWFTSAPSIQSFSSSYIHVRCKTKFKPGWCTMLKSKRTVRLTFSSHYSQYVLRTTWVTLSHHKPLYILHL